LKRLRRWREPDQLGRSDDVLRIEVARQRMQSSGEAIERVA
jgi:hypothetical protein